MAEEKVLDIENLTIRTQEHTLVDGISLHLYKVRFWG